MSLRKVACFAVGGLAPPRIRRILGGRRNHVRWGLPADPRNLDRRFHSMPSRRFRPTLRGGLAVGAGANMASALAISPAYAGDDGAAPIWEGIGSIFRPLSRLRKRERPQIDYRDRGRLVLPPKIAASFSERGRRIGNVDWPVDPDVQRQKKAKQEPKAPNREHFGRYVPPLVTPGSQGDDDCEGGAGPRRPAALPKGRRAGRCSQQSQVPTTAIPRSISIR